MKTDLLIIGSGGAALSAALEAKRAGIGTLVVSEGYPTRSQTCMAQGGINAALGNVEPDSIEMHIADTIKASGGIASEKMIRKMCENAPETIAWLDHIGMPFSRTEEKKIAQRRLGGASSKRACYAQDYSGLKILHTLYDQTLKEGVDFVNEHFLLDLIVEDHRVCGAYFLDIRTCEVKSIEASAVIIATGGYSALYYGYTTNQHGATGDGIAAALRAGATVANMEFVQFHPTGLKSSGILISESARGAGGRLLNQNLERFVDELKPRDQVSRAIWEQIKVGNEVFLDIRHLGEAYIDEHIPQERRLAITYEGVDPVTDLIPIAPVAHYSMGGIKTDERMMSTIRGLFAVGECASAGVHGANRLGGNSLLEVTAFGRIAGKEAAVYAKERSAHALFEADTKSMQQRIEALFELPLEIDFYEKREKLGKTAYEKGGIERNEKDLEMLYEKVCHLKENLSKMGVFDKGTTYNTNLIERLKFANSLEIAEALLLSALERKESRGAHFRSDYPSASEKYEKETLCRKEERSLRIDFERSVS
ncbi:MAG: succinate dehydrogenase [Campylobacteraceae bacterium 4484_4]|nr:MAG: succinate dehydrogenase [Campylobacteraceae bacterium 4484_4]